MSRKKLPLVNYSPVDVGRRLDELRQALRLKQRDFATLLGLSQGMISQVVGGAKNLSAEKLFLLHAIYDVNLNWLLAGRGDPFLKGAQLDLAAESPAPYNRKRTKKEISREIRKLLKELEEG